MKDPTDLAIDGDLVRNLAALLEETGLSEIEYAVGDRRIRVARGAVATIAAPAMAPTHAGPASGPTVAPTLAPADHPGAIKSPMVGTAYLSPQPGDPPFVKIGDMIAEGQVILIVEAMKVMNQIRAARAGRLAQILVADGTPVEFGEVLMLLE